MLDLFVLIYVGTFPSITINNLLNQIQMRTSTVKMICYGFFGLWQVMLFGQHNTEKRNELRSSYYVNPNTIEYNKKHASSKLDEVLKEACLGKKQDLIIQNNGLLLVNGYPSTDVNKLKASLEKIGIGGIEIRGAAYLTAWIAPSQLEQLEDVADLKYASCNMHGSSNSFSSTTGTKNLGAKTGRVVSQGDRAMLTDLLRNTYKVNGCGIKIGVISDSYNVLGGVPQGIRDGDLPGPENPNGFTTGVTVLREGVDNDTDEGRAMIEIIHDIAPGAEVFFHSASFGIQNFANAYLELADAGVDIIVDDWFYFVEPVFQDGVISQAIDEVSSRGVAVFTSAGNLNSDFTIESSFKDSNLSLDVTKGLRFHDFGTGNRSDFRFAFDQSIINVPALKVVVPPNSSYTITLQWDETSVFANPDINNVKADLELFPVINTPNGPIFVSDFTSSYDNNAIGDPFETTTFFNSTNRTLDLRLMLFSISGEIPSRIKLIERDRNIRIGEGSSDGTVLGHSMAETVIAVGAVNFNDTPAFNRPLRPAFFSSLGGVEILIDRNGDQLANPILRQKPNVMGPQGANNTFFGIDTSIDEDDFPNFFGTSSSAPHVAAATALIYETIGMQNEDRVITSNEITEVLQNTATDFNARGFDNQTGFGYINPEKALESLLAQEPCLVSFQLIDAESKEVIQTLNNNDVIDLEKVPSGRVTIQTIVNLKGDNDRKLVRFKLESDFQRNSQSSTASKAPYIAFNGRRFANVLNKNGNYTFTATPITFAGPGIKRTVDFSIVNGIEPGRRVRRAYSILDNNSFAINKSSISPNPTHGAFNVVNSAGLKNIKVYSFSGDLVYENNSPDKENYIDVSGQTKGIYLVNIVDANGEATIEKLVVN